MAEGMTWEVNAPAGAPPPAGVVVSAISKPSGTRYRVVSEAPPGPDAVAVAPSLEDGYVALMRRPAR